MKATKTNLKKHPRYHAEDLKNLREKGYTNEEIKAIWDRDEECDLRRADDTILKEKSK